MYPAMHLDAEYHDDGTVKRQGADYYLKPMNCPMHNLIFSARGRSYRELPLRLFEFGTVYRYEKSGVVHGLTRARGFTQDDAHIYCTLEQLPGELKSLLDFVLGLLRDYGLTDFYLELSTKNPEKSVGTDEEWVEATEILRSAAESQGLELVLMKVVLRSTAPRSRCRQKTRSGELGKCPRFRWTFNYHSVLSWSIKLLMAPANARSWCTELYLDPLNGSSPYFLNTTPVRSLRGLHPFRSLEFRSLMRMLII